MLQKLEKLFDEHVRPSLASHGGNVEIVDLDNDILYVRLHGGCQGCSSSKVTLNEGIHKLVKKNFPNIVDIVDLTDHKEGENPYM
jgi:Fe/S biogenesis protein NfuA